MIKIGKAILTYLTDWKNILAHSVLGTMSLAVMLFLPVSIFMRIGLVVLVVIFNVFRMKRKKDSVKKV